MRKDCWIQGNGPLVPFAAAFRVELEEAGHPAGSVKHYLLLMGGLNRWLCVEGIGLESLTPRVAQRFLDSKRDAGHWRIPTLVSLRPLFSCLERAGVVPPESPIEPTPLESLLADYRRHLLGERGLTTTTVRRYENFARRFLTERARRAGTESGVEGLTSVEVNAFMLDASARLVVALCVNLQ